MKELQILYKTYINPLASLAELHLFYSKFDINQIFVGIPEDITRQHNHNSIKIEEAKEYIFKNIF